jgi:hypothetical protein
VAGIMEIDAHRWWESEFIVGITRITDRVRSSRNAISGNFTAVKGYRPTGTVINGNMVILDRVAALFSRVADPALLAYP